MQTTIKKYVGVDIAKTNFVADLPGGPRTFSQEPEDHARFLEALPKEAHVVCEATGGYEKSLLATLSKAGVTCSLVMPKRVRDFARSQGILAKNDRIDSRVLTHFASASKLRIYQQPSQAQRELKELMHARDALIEQQKIEASHAEHVGSVQLLKTQSENRRKMIEEQLKQIEQAMETLIASDCALNDRARRCHDVQGVGKVTIWALLCELPELGNLRKGQAAYLLGVAPLCRDSGSFNGRREIHAGRARARRVFYMAAISASRHNPVLASFYQSLIAKGKPAKLALVAVMRKLVELLNLLLKYPDFCLAQ